MKISKLVIFFVFILFISELPAQYMSSPKLSGVGVPFFYASVFRTFDKTGDSRIIRLYIQILNDDLTFVKEEELYTADIQFEIYISNKEKEYVFNRTVKKQVVCKNYAETNSRKIKSTFKTDIVLEPNDYDAVITVLDKNSNKQVNRKLHFSVEGLDKQNFLISDVLFFTKFETDSAGNILSFEPNLTNNFSDGENYFYFYFASAVKDSTDSLNISYSIKNPAGAVTYFSQYFLRNGRRFNEHYIRINRAQFDQSRYELVVDGRYKEHVLEAQRLFSFYWTVSPDSPKDLDLALRQMHYLMDADSVGWALKQPYEEKLAYFKRVWRRMDPNPETEKNELMDEYYHRINFSNENYSTLSNEGWETDRGRIFVKFGQPDDIERHPFEMEGTPYVVWRYYNLQKTFVFVDRTGFGDYYLHPNYLDEEYN